MAERFYFSAIPFRERDKNGRKIRLFKMQQIIYQIVKNGERAKKNPRLSAEEKKNPCQVHLSADSSFLLHRPAAGGRGCASIASKSRRGNNAIKKYLSRTPCPQHLVLRGNVRQGNKMPPDARQHAFQVPVGIHRVTDFSASINYK